MSAAEDVWDSWALPVCVCLMLIWALALWCVDRDDEERGARARLHRCQSPPPVPVPAPPRRAAARCKVCCLPVRYENHPGGRDDALALHAAYECSEQPAMRRDG